MRLRSRQSKLWKTASSLVHLRHLVSSADAFREDRRPDQPGGGCHDAARNTCSPSSMKKATGAANWKPTPRSNPTTSCCTRSGTGNPERFQKAARYILHHQNEDGGWSIYAGGPSNISASVKCLFRAEAGRLQRRPSGAGARPQEDSGNGRRDRGQHLHQDLSLFLRAV